MKELILFGVVVTIFLALCSLHVQAAVKSYGWVQYRNAIEPSFLETHGIYHENMINLVDHERARLITQSTGNQDLSCSTLEVDVENIEISKPAILLKFQKNSGCMLSIGNSVTDMNSLQYRICCSNEMVEGFKDAAKFHDALSFTKYILSQSDGAMWKKLIGPVTETLSSAASTDDDFFSSDDGNDNKFDDTWFKTNDDMYVDDVSDDDSAMDDKQSDADDDLHIFQSRRRLESEKKQIKRLCKRYGVCPAVFTPDLTECKIRHTKTVIPCHYDNVTGDDDEADDDNDNNKNWKHAERKVYRNCIHHGICPPVLTEGLTECMVRHKNITVACVYDESDASLLTGIPFMPGEQSQAEAEANNNQVDFGFINDDSDDNGDDDYYYDTDPVPSVGTHGDDHKDRHIQRECDRHGICPITQLDGIDECHIRHTNISMICKYSSGNLIFTYPKSSVLEDHETPLGHHYHHNDHTTNDDHSRGGRHQKRDIKRDCDRHGICPLIEIDGIDKCPLRHSNVTMMCEYQNNRLILTYPKVTDPEVTDALNPTVGFEVPVHSVGTHDEDHNHRHIKRECDRHGICPPMEMDGIKECPVRHTNVTMVCGYNHGLLIYTYPKYVDSTLDIPYGDLEASEPELGGRGFGNHFKRDMKRECDRYGVCPVMEIDHINECHIRHTNITMMCEYRDKILVLIYPKMNDSPLSAEGLSSMFASDDTLMDDFQTDDFFSGDDDTYRVTTHDDWGGDNDDGEDDINGGSDDAVPEDDDASKDNDDDMHIFTPNPTSSTVRTLHVEQFILPAFSLSERVLDKDISSLAAVGTLRTITISLQDLADDHFLSGADLSDSLILKIITEKGYVVQMGGKSSSGVEIHNWPSSWKTEQQSKFGVTREIRLPITTADTNNLKIQMSVLHLSSGETVGGVVSLGFELNEPSNGLSWFLVVSIVAILAAVVTTLKSKFSKSTEYEYQHIPVSSMYKENLDVEMTVNTKPVNIQNTSYGSGYTPGISGYQTI